MNLIVLTPEHELFQGEVTAVKVPGVAGQFEVLNGHAPIVSALGQGKVYITQPSGEKKEYAISQGFIEVLNNEVAVLATGVEEK